MDSQIVMFLNTLYIKGVFNINKYIFCNMKFQYYFLLLQRLCLLQSKTLMSIILFVII